MEEWASMKPKDLGASVTVNVKCRDLPFCLCSTAKPKHMQVKVFKKEKIHTLKLRLQEKYSRPEQGIIPKKQRLVFQDAKEKFTSWKDLDDQQTVEDYGMENGTNLMLKVRTKEYHTEFEHTWQYFAEEDSLRRPDPAGGPQLRPSHFDEKKCRNHYRLLYRTGTFIKLGEDEEDAGEYEGEDE